VHATIGVTALALKAWRSARPWPWLLATGVVTGLGMYFRPGVLLVPVALALAALPWIGWRRTLAAALVPLVAAAALAAPWTVRNYEEFDRFIPMRIGVGQNLWEGLGEIDNDFGAVLDDQVTERQVREEDPSLVYGTPEYDEHLREKAVEAIQDHPGHAAKLVVRRAFVTTVGLHNLDLPLGLAEPLLFVLAVAVAVATWRRFPRQNAFLAAVPIATLLPYLVLHVEPRYMLPASFAYLIWLALGADLLLERR
jgi:4-amino-4-deoxy-L-arabinose transferase-like glycosyltransferase